jgi:hypothetical protein
VRLISEVDETIRSNYCGGNRAVSALAGSKPAVAVTRIAAICRDAGYSDDWEGISPFVTPSVLWRLYSVLHSPDDYWEAICTAIAGEVDTTAAMAGAISGALVGLRGIPAEPCSLLSDRGAWGYEALVQLATDLYNLNRRLSQAQ